MNGNGCNETGDGIVADYCVYPGGVPIINISGGTIISKNANAIEAYDKEGNRAPESEQINIVGGKFSSKPADVYLGKGLAAELKNGMYEIVSA